MTTLEEGREKLIKSDECFKFQKGQHKAGSEDLGAKQTLYDSMWTIVDGSFLIQTCSWLAYKCCLGKHTGMRVPY